MLSQEEQKPVRPLLSVLLPCDQMWRRDLAHSTVLAACGGRGLCDTHTHRSGPSEPGHRSGQEQPCSGGTAPGGHILPGLPGQQGQDSPCRGPAETPVPAALGSPESKRGRR